MNIFSKIISGTTCVAAFAVAAPAGAQYYQSYGYNPYRANSTALATQRCSAAVQNRLYNRSSLGSILGSLIGVPQNSGRITAITQVTPNRSYVRVRGVASSGRYAYNNYGPYGVGAYGALGYNMAAQSDLSFKCDVDYRGYVRDVDINRRY